MPYLPPPDSFLLAYFTAYFALTVGWRAVVVYRRTGVNPLARPAASDVYDYVNNAFKVVMAGCAIVVLGIALLPNATGWLAPYPLLKHPATAIVGWVLLLFSLVWLLLAQRQMGASWRIGIDSEHETALIETGLFALSRNPIYLAIRMTLFGLFLVFPSSATVAILVAGDFLIQLKVRLEEQHLATVHGEPYAAYCNKVRRWI